MAQRPIPIQWSPDGLREGMYWRGVSVPMRDGGVNAWIVILFLPLEFWWLGASDLPGRGIPCVGAIRRW